jgi:hypothetical protein
VIFVLLNNQRPFEVLNLIYLIGRHFLIYIQVLGGALNPISKLFSVENATIVKKLNKATSSFGEVLFYSKLKYIL